MNSTQRNLNRRQLLQGAGLLGLTSVLPTLLAACGGGSDDGSQTGGGLLGGTENQPPTRETRTLQFDLSMGTIAEPYLSLPNSKSNRAPLRAHTDETRAFQRALNPLLRSIPDAKLTHFLDNVDVPGQALQLGSVWGKHPTSGQAMVAMTFLHVPKSSLLALEKRRSGRGQTARALNGNLRTYGVSQSELDAAPAESENSLVNPLDIATALIFQHPAITNLDPDLGADIQDRILNLPCAENDDSCTPYSGTLAFQIAELIGANNFPTTSSTNSWASLSTIVDPTTGQLAVDDNGALIYTYNVNPVLTDPLSAAVKSILNDINNDTLFQGTNWQSTEGGVSAQVATPSTLATAAAAALGDGEFNVVSSIPIGARRSGIRLKSISCDDNRNVVFTVLNEYIRSAGVYVQYFDGNGVSIPNTNPTTYDDGDAYFNSVVSPQVNVMGIPLQDGKGAITTNFRFTMPTTAASASVYYGGLGLGGSDAFSKKALIGSLVTLVLNIALPTAFLVAGVAVTYGTGISQTFQKALEDPVTLQQILTAAGKSVFGGPAQGGIQSSITNLSIVPFLSGVGATVLQIFMSAAPRLAAQLAVAIGESKLATAVPYLGLALFVLSTLADLATIAETFVEILSCPAIDETKVSLTMASSVQISRDPNDYQFPATARTIAVKAYYDGGTTPIVASGTLTTGQVDPITIALTTTDANGNPQGVPSGGNVLVDVYLYSASGCLVGQGSSASISNLPATATVIPVTITEILVPLDATTTYQHQSKLSYDNGAHVWDASAPAPSLTHANLCQGSDGAICALHGLTVHTASGMAGYSYDAGGQGVTLCNGGSQNSMNMIENVFLGRNPDSGLKSISCGEWQPIGIVYSPTGKVTGGQNFFLQPDPSNMYLWHLRGTDLVAGDFDMTQTMTWGAFSNPLDSMCVVAAGYVAGVNRSTHKMEILRLNATASSTQETQSGQFSALKSGYGSGLGRLNTPVAIAAYDGAMLVLEQGNQRVQAFNVDGDTVALFTDASGAKTALMPLKVESDVTYLDLAVEGAGYMYVLSYISSGNSPANYRVDLYSPDGTFLSRTSNVAAGNIAVDLFRNLYTLNYETVAGAPRVEPSLSQWLPYSTTPCAGTSSATTLASPRFAMTCGVPAAARAR